MPAMMIAIKRSSIFEPSLLVKHLISIEAIGWTLDSPWSFAADFQSAAKQYGRRCGHRARLFDLHVARGQICCPAAAGVQTIGACAGAVGLKRDGGWVARRAYAGDGESIFPIERLVCAGKSIVMVFIVWLGGLQ
jgi:hypothetical protein